MLAEIEPPLSSDDLATCQAMLNEAWAEREEIDRLLVQTLSRSIEVERRTDVARGWAIVAFASFAATLLLLFLPP